MNTPGPAGTELPIPHHWHDNVSEVFVTITTASEAEQTSVSPGSRPPRKNSKRTRVPASPGPSTLWERAAARAWRTGPGGGITVRQLRKSERPREEVPVQEEAPRPLSPLALATEFPPPPPRLPSGTSGVGPPSSVIRGTTSGGSTRRGGQTAQGGPPSGGGARSAARYHRAAEGREARREVCHEAQLAALDSEARHSADKHPGGCTPNEGFNDIKPYSGNRDLRTPPLF